MVSFHLVRMRRQVAATANRNFSHGRRIEPCIQHAESFMLVLALTQRVHTRYAHRQLQM